MDTQLTARDDLLMAEDTVLGSRHTLTRLKAANCEVNDCRTMGFLREVEERRKKFLFSIKLH